MDARLKPVNALLGLCIPGDLNPSVLYDAGFRVAGLEIPVLTPDGRVVIDVLLVHPERSHLVVCESKSGANVDAAPGSTSLWTPAASYLLARWTSRRGQRRPLRASTCA